MPIYTPILFYVNGIYRVYNIYTMCAYKAIFHKCLKFKTPSNTNVIFIVSVDIFRPGNQYNLSLHYRACRYIDM